MDDPTEEILMAYADGVLDNAEHARITAMLANRPDLRARLAVFTSTGRALGAHYAKPMREPVPEHLVDLVTGSPGRTSAAGVPRRDDRQTSTFWSLLSRAVTFELPRFQTALAYSAILMIGAAGGWYGATMADRDRSRGTTLAALEDGALLAGSSLARVLETTPSLQRVALASSDPASANVTVRVLLTFKSSEGYCRQYDVLSNDALSSAGIACRGTDGRWRLNVHAARLGGPSTPGKSRPADKRTHDVFPPIIDDMMDGDALGRDDETELLSKGWRP